MEEHKDLLGMLDLMARPGFCVKENQIIKVNQAAQGYFLSPGMAVDALLATGKDEYAEFSCGCLYLSLSLSGKVLGASVTRMQDVDIFLIDQESDHTELQAMALAARELRGPLSSVMATAGRLFPQVLSQDDTQTQDQVARMNRGLFQMLRILGNMADAQRYSAASRQETVAINRELEEIFRKAGDLIGQTGIQLTYTLPDRSIYCLADREQLERAVLNMLSNAVKFTPAGGTIEASLNCRGRMLRISIQDSGAGMEESVRANVFRRYLRNLTIEDSRYGIGLGMALIRSAATNHGGTVLIDQHAGKGTRITMTMAIRENTDTVLRSPITRIDYAGGYDHMLLELSDSLPAGIYKKEI